MIQKFWLLIAIWTFAALASCKPDVLEDCFVSNGPPRTREIELPVSPYKLFIHDNLNVVWHFSEKSWIQIEGGVIKNYQVIAPTTWNVGPNDDSGNSGPIEAALEGTEIEDPHDPVEVGMVARSFDSCLVCTVHAHDGKTGEQLAKFKL